MSIGTTLFGGIALGLGALGVGMFADIELRTAALLGFVASFASTVFVVKVLEERDDMNALYGLIAIGVLVMEDLAAVVFLAISKGKLPSPWALGLLALVPLRPYLQRLLARIGHGELLMLAGVAAALGGRCSSRASTSRVTSGPSRPAYCSQDTRSRVSSPSRCSA